MLTSREEPADRTNMKTYNPFVAAFLAGFVLSASLGNGALGAWVLFALVASIISVALVMCIKAQNDDAIEAEQNA